MPWQNKARSRSLSRRLLAAYVAAWIVAAILFDSLGGWALRADGQLLEHSAERALHKLATNVRYDADGHPYMEALPKQLQWLFISAPLDAGYRLFDENGQTLLWSSEPTRDAWAHSALLDHPAPLRSNTFLQGVSIHAARMALPAPDGRTLWLQVAISERLMALRHDELGSTFEFTIAFAALISIILFGLVLWGVLLRVMAPIQRVSLEAQEIEPRGPWQRLSTHDLPCEIEPLVHSFNQALDRLEEGFERQQRFLADAAHELKTPLALLRAHLELGSDDRTAMLQDINHMSRQVQQLLMLAEVSEPRSYQREQISPHAVISDALSFLTPLAATHDLVLQCNNTNPPHQDQLLGDRSALFVLLKNLIENAIHVAPSGTTVELGIDDKAITVRDYGPGIAPHNLPHLFERFWRVPGSREGGAGLGLAICQEVAAAHGWQLSVRNVEPGTEFRLDFARITS